MIVIVIVLSLAIVIVLSLAIVITRNHNSTHTQICIVILVIIQVISVASRSTSTSTSDSKHTSNSTGNRSSNIIGTNGRHLSRSRHTRSRSVSPCKAGSSNDGTPSDLVGARLKLEKQWADLHKATKIATKAYDQAELVEPQTGRFSSLLDQLRTALQEADIQKEDLAYVLKYRVSKDGAELSIPLAVTMTKASVAAFQSLVDSNKAMRACMPKKVHEPEE